MSLSDFNGVKPADVKRWVPVDSGPETKKSPVDQKSSSLANDALKSSKTASSSDLAGKVGTRDASSEIDGKVLTEAQLAGVITSQPIEAPPSPEGAMLDERVNQVAQELVELKEEEITSCICRGAGITREEHSIIMEYIRGNPEKFSGGVEKPIRIGKKAADLPRSLIHFPGRGTYVINKEDKLGSGGFKTIYHAINLFDGSKDAFGLPKKVEVEGGLLERISAKEAIPDSEIKTIKLFRGEDQYFVGGHIIEYVGKGGALKRGLLMPIMTPLDTVFDKLDFKDKLRVAYHVAIAISKMHEHKTELGEPDPWINKDLKPENILIGSDGFPRLADLGMAKRAEGEMDAKGSLAYMAPERFTGSSLREEAGGALADVFSFGCILAEVLYHSWDIFDNEELFQHLSNEPPNPDPKDPNFEVEYKRWEKEYNKWDERREEIMANSIFVTGFVTNTLEGFHQFMKETEQENQINLARSPADITRACLSENPRERPSIREASDQLLKCMQELGIKPGPIQNMPK